MPVSGPDVLVVGAGVSGLTTAVCLAEAGHGVEIRADRLPAGHHLGRGRRALGAAPGGDG